MLIQFFNDAVTRLQERSGSDNSGQIVYTLEVIRHLQKLYSDKRSVAWCSVCTPFDLLNAMNVDSCFVELLGGVLSVAGMVVPFLEEAEHNGYPSDSCGLHRAAIGAALRDEMPVPDIMIATNSPCTGGVVAVENLARRFNRPLYTLVTPPDNSERNVRYLAEQYRRMIDFVTAHTGHHLDENRLQEAMEKTNQAREAAIELFDLVRRVPSPTKRFELRALCLVVPVFYGTDIAVEIIQAFRNELSARIEQRTGKVHQERFRLMWLQECIQFHNPLIKMIEEDYQATVVVEELNNVYWEPIDLDDPYIGLAKRAIEFPFNGPVIRRLDHIQKLIKAYKIDGAINPCHWGCRQGSGARGLIQTTLQKLDIPVINLEVDTIDPRNFAEGQLRTRIESFMELLSSRRGCQTTKSDLTERQSSAAQDRTVPPTR